MDEDKRDKENRNPGDSSGIEHKEWSQTFIAGFRAMLQRHGYPVEGNRARTSPSTTTLCHKTEVSPAKLGEKHGWIPSFSSYEDLIQKTLKSLDGFMIILNTDGVIMFVASRVFLLLGHISEEIMGKTLLSLLPDSEKSRVYQKISLKGPLSSSVGRHITFGCHLRRGSVECGYNPTYEYAKIILNVIDISEEPLAIFTQLFSRRPPEASMNLPPEDRFYLVGLVCVIKSQVLQELCAPKEGEETEEETDDEASLDYSFRRITYPGSTYRGITCRSEVLSVDPEGSPSDDQASIVTVEHIESRNSSNECNAESASSTGSHSSSPEVSPSWNALTCFSFSVDHKGQAVSRTKTVVPSYKYCVVEMEESPSVENVVAMEEVAGEEAVAEPVVEEPVQKEEQQVKEVESVAKAGRAELVQEVQPAEEAAEVEDANEAQAAGPGEQSKLAMKAQPAEKSTGKADPGSEVEPAKEGEVERVEVAQEALQAAGFADGARVTERVEKLENLQEAERETLPYFSLTANVSAQTLEPVTAPMATTTLAVEDITGLLQADTEYSYEILEETTEQLETVGDPESPSSTSGPSDSPGSQASETVTKHAGKLKRSHSDVVKAKRFRASPVSHTITSEELGEPYDTSTQVQLPKAEAQDTPSPSAAQDPAEGPAEGAELPSSGDEQHVRGKP